MIVRIMLQNVVSMVTTATLLFIRIMLNIGTENTRALAPNIDALNCNKWNFPYPRHKSI